MKAIYLSNNLSDFKRVYSEDIKKQIAQLFEIEDCCFNKDTLINSIEVEIIFSTWGMPSYTHEEIKKIFPKLKAIFYSAGSVQYFAKPFLNLGIRVFSSWHANAVPVIEYAVSQILLATKGFFLLSNMCKKSYLDAKNIMNNFKGNYNSKIGILGYGAIAKGVINELLKHKLDIYVYAPDITKEDADKLGINKVDNLTYIFKNCDVISNHIANLPSTFNIINKDIINLLDNYQTFINTGRCQQVDEKALLNKLKDNPLLSAVLDVTYPEPPKQDSDYFKLDNLFITPHIAGSSGNEVIRMAEYMLLEAKRYLNKENCLYEVTLKMLERMA